MSIKQPEGQGDDRVPTQAEEAAYMKDDAPPPKKSTVSNVRGMSAKLFVETCLAYGGKVSVPTQRGEATRVDFTKAGGPVTGYISFWFTVKLGVVTDANEASLQVADIYGADVDILGGDLVVIYDGDPDPVHYVRQPFKPATGGIVTAPVPQDFVRAGEVVMPGRDAFERTIPRRLQASAGQVGTFMPETSVPPKGGTASRVGGPAERSSDDGRLDIYFRDNNGKPFRDGQPRVRDSVTGELRQMTQQERGQAQDGMRFDNTEGKDRTPLHAASGGNMRLSRDEAIAMGADADRLTEQFLGTVESKEQELLTQYAAAYQQTTGLPANQCVLVRWEDGDGAVHFRFRPSKAIVVPSDSVAYTKIESVLIAVDTCLDALQGLSGTVDRTHELVKETLEYLAKTEKKPPLSVPDIDAAKHPVEILDRLARASGYPLATDWDAQIAALRKKCDGAAVREQNLVEAILAEIEETGEDYVWVRFRENDEEKEQISLVEYLRDKFNIKAPPRAEPEAPLFAPMSEEAAVSKWWAIQYHSGPWYRTATESTTNEIDAFCFPTQERAEETGKRLGLGYFIVPISEATMRQHDKNQSPPDADHPGPTGG